MWLARIRTALLLGALVLAAWRGLEVLSAPGDDAEAGRRALEAGRYPEAVAFLERAHQVKPKDDWISLDLAESLFRVGRKKDAADLYGQCWQTLNDANAVVVTKRHRDHIADLRAQGY